MKRIDTSRWKAFPVGELFDVTRPAARSQASYEEGKVPFVASGNYNNGVVKYCEPKEDDTLDPKGCISVSPLDGSAFYQPVDFLGRGGAGSAILLLHNGKMTEMSGLFISAVLRAALTKFKYNDQINSQTILVQEIMLPVTDDNKPDFEYMDSYMKDVIKESETSLENLRRADKSKSSVDTECWKTFCIEDLFDVVKGTRLTKANMEDGPIKFIGSSAMNNGETHRISNSDYLHPKNTITVCYNGSVGETFYQDEEFWASDDVNVLYPKFKMTKNMALFVCPIIKSAGQKYAFVDKWKQEDMKKTKISLPATPEGDPDWKYMDSYMSSLLKSTAEGLGTLSEII